MVWWVRCHRRLWFSICEVNTLATDDFGLVFAWATHWFSICAGNTLTGNTTLQPYNTSTKTVQSVKRLMRTRRDDGFFDCRTSGDGDHTDDCLNSSIEDVDFTRVFLQDIGWQLETSVNAYMMMIAVRRNQRC